jgi:hypothetical protein
MTETTVVLPKETLRALTELTGEARTDVALTLMMRDYARQKLAEIDAALRRYDMKGSTGCPSKRTNEYGRLKTVEEHYTHQAEWDYLEWESLATRRERLMGSFSWLP